MKNTRKQVQRRDYLLKRMSEMEDTVAMYGTMASSTPFTEARIFYKEMAQIFLRRYQWYLNKLTHEN